MATFFQPHASSFVALWLPKGCSTPNAGRSCPRACHVRPPVMPCFSQASALRWRRWRRRQWWCRATPPCDRCAHGGTNCRDDYGFMMHAARWRTMRSRRATGCQEHAIRDRPPAQQVRSGSYCMEFKTCFSIILTAADSWCTPQAGLVGLGGWKGEGPVKMEARALVRHREKQTYINKKHLHCSCLIEDAECRGAVGFKAAASK